MITRDPKNILIADDSLFFRAKLSDILTEAGHMVRFAKDGKEVIEEIKAIKANAKGLDLIVLDLQMPEVDGFGVLDWINREGYREGLRILAITGAYEPTEVLERLKGLGANGFMSKDLQPEQIIFRVNRLLYAHKAGDGVKRDRVPVSIPADFTFGEATYTGMLLNLSEGGAFLHTTVRLIQGAMLELKFSIPDYRKLVHARGVVKWAPHEFDGNFLFCGYGIMFTSVDREDEEAINDFIAGEVEKIERVLGD